MFKLKVAATYVSTRGPGSIIGDGRLNFQVRNGAGCDPPSSPTTKRDKDTDVCLALLVNKTLRKLELLRVQVTLIDYKVTRVTIKCDYALNKVVPVNE